MSVDLNTYNSPAGKIDLLTGRGALSIVKPVTITVTGTVNTVGGAVFSHGSDIPDGWTFGAARTWMDMTSAYPQPAYYSFVPSPALPAAGCMVAIYAEFEHATVNDQWNGKGEVALYGRFDDNAEDIRVLMYQGKTGEVGPCFSGGWMNPGDGQSTCFIVHYRDIFQEVAGLEDKTWADVKEIRFVFRNETAGRKVKIRDFRIYENVLVGPSGSVSSYSSTVDSVTFTMDASGADSTVGAGKSGINKMSVDVVNAATSMNVVYPLGSPQETISGNVTFTGLPSAARTDYIVLEDTYGNISYVEDSHSALTEPTWSFTAVPDVDWESADLTLDVDSTGLTLVNYCFYQEQMDDETGVKSMVPVDSDAPDPEPPTPITQMFQAELDSTGGAKFQVKAYFRSIIVGRTYFFTADRTVPVADTREPEVLLDAYSAQSHGFVSIRAYDASGIAQVTYTLKREGQADLLFKTTTPSPVLPQLDDSCDFGGNPGEIITVVVRVTDGAGNVKQFDVDLQIIKGGDIITSGFAVTPEIKATIGADAHVLLEWTSWGVWMPAIAGVRYPPTEFEVYRKTEAGGTYQNLADGLPAATRSFIDDTLTSPAVYYYCIVGIDKFGQRKSIEIAADVAAATTETRYSFIEDYLQLLPKWTAAVAKTDTFGES